MKLSEAEKGRLLYISVFWESPWERMTTWLWKIDWRTGQIKANIRDGSLRDRLAEFTDRRDRAWVMRYGLRNTTPPERWRRRISPCRPASVPRVEEPSPE